MLAGPVTTGIFGDQWESAVPAVRVLTFRDVNVEELAKQESGAPPFLPEQAG